VDNCGELGSPRWAIQPTHCHCSTSDGDLTLSRMAAIQESYPAGRALVGRIAVAFAGAFSLAEMQLKPRIGGPNTGFRHLARRSELAEDALEDEPSLAGQRRMPAGERALQSHLEDAIRARRECRAHGRLTCLGEQNGGRDGARSTG
jgi:hypothetical protein